MLLFLLTKNSNKTLISSKYRKVDIKVLWKKGIAKTYEFINPAKVFSYIAKVNQAPKFVIIKKEIELTKALKKISANLNFLTKRPIKTATHKEI